MRDECSPRSHRELPDMAHLATGSIVPQIESLFDGGSVAGLTDRELLERFTARRDAGGGSWRSPRWWRGTGRWCWASAARSWATATMPRMPFRPSSSSWPARLARSGIPTWLGSWLYGVALRTARRAKSRLNRQRKNEEGDAVSGQVMVATAEPPACQPTFQRWPASRPRSSTARSPAYPDRFACRWSSATSRASRSTRRRGDSGGPSARSAAGWPGPAKNSAAGSTRRGVVLPTTALAAALNPRSASASVSSHLCEITTRAAIELRGRAGCRGRRVNLAAALAKEVLGSMCSTMRKSPR